MTPLAHRARFNLDDLLQDATGKPLSMALELIDFDPAQPRRQIDETALQELAASIREHGVLQPVSLRPHPEIKERYLINMGERRVRAARLVEGLQTIPAFIEARCDPFAQAAENVHREELAGLDLAHFIALREAEGCSRTEIALRLGKPKSFITEIAALHDAPAEIVSAFQRGQIPDTRVAYELVRAHEANPTGVRALLARRTPIKRQESAALGGRNTLAKRDPGTSAPSARRGRLAPIPFERQTPQKTLAFRVEVEGHRGLLRLVPAASTDSALVEFDDGTRDTIALARIALMAWTHTQ